MNMFETAASLAVKDKEASENIMEIQEQTG